MLHGPFYSATLGGEFYYHDDTHTIRRVGLPPMDCPGHITLQTLGVYGPYNSQAYGGTFWYYKAKREIRSGDGTRRKLTDDFDDSKFTGQGQSSRQAGSSAQAGMAAQPSSVATAVGTLGNQESLRNFAILNLPVDRGHHEWAPNTDEYSILLTVCSRVIDIFVSKRGKSKMMEFVRFWKGSPEFFNTQHPEVLRLAGCFLGKINRESPLLVSDERFKDNPALVAEHPRRPWTGNPREFDVRGQTIRINSFWLAFAVDCRTRIRKGDNAALEAYLLAFFKLVHAITHEYMHLFMTMLGNGREDTPSRISGGMNSRNYHGDNEGEAGEFGEKSFFDGVLDFHPDSHRHGDLKYDGYAVGWPWVRCADQKSRRISIQSIARLVQPGWTDPGDQTTPFLSSDSSIGAIKTQKSPRHQDVVAAAVDIEPPAGRTVALASIRIVSHALMTVSNR